MLRVENIDVAYGDVQVLHDVSIDINQGELIAVIGSNGAGKSTLLKTISGILTPKNGVIYFNDEEISSKPPNKIVEKGIIQIPEGRLLFPGMSIRENLEMGAYRLKSKTEINERYEEVFEMFPILKERETQLAGTLSGGEQQMLAIGRGLMAKPSLLMLDEPSLGLAPILVQAIFKMIIRINKELGITVLLVEQNVQHSCQISDRAFVIENGTITMKGTGLEMLNNDHVREAYLGL